MNRNPKITFLFLGLLLLLVIPARVFAAGVHAPLRDEINGNKILINETFILKSGDILNGQIIAYDSRIDIEENSDVNGQVVMLGGNIHMLGHINGNLICVSCTGDIGTTAEVNGNIVQVSSDLEISSDADISGFTDLGNISNINFSNLTGGFLSSPNQEVSLVSRILTSIFSVLAISALGVLATILFPKAIDRTAAASLHNPGISIGVGCLSLLVWFVGVIILTLTIILIPVSLLSIPLLLIAVILGWISLGHEIGRRINTASEQKWPEPVVTGIGLLILGSITAALNYIPCIGGLLVFVLSLIALGSVVLSRMGTYDYTEQTPKAATHQGSTGMTTSPVTPTPVASKKAASPPPLPPVITAEKTAEQPKQTTAPKKPGGEQLKKKTGK